MTFSARGVQSEHSLNVKVIISRYSLLSAVLYAPIYLLKYVRTNVSMSQAFKKIILINENHWPVLSTAGRGLELRKMAAFNGEVPMIED